MIEIDENLPLSEQFRIVGEAFVAADAAANILEETKSAVLAQLMSKQGDLPVNKREMNVKSSREWMNFITEMVQAREKASLLQVQREYIRMKFHEWQSIEATRRQEMRL
jgi:hypothetical protein